MNDEFVSATVRLWVEVKRVGEQMVYDGAAKEESGTFEFGDDDDESRVDFEELVASVEDVDIN